MKKALIGRKIGMTQIFDAEGKVIPVTAIEVGPCTVVQIKTKEQDGYEAVQLGFADVKERIRLEFAIEYANNELENIK